jgi:nicotinate phosphoribosyltransferase
MIIDSMLDTDLYKFTMMQVVLHHFPGAQVEYVFKCRTEGVDLAPHLDEIRAGIADLCKLRFRDDELAYLRGLRFMKSDFVDFLGLFQFNARNIRVERAPGEPCGVDITIRGPWLHTIMYEIPVLAIISEVYFRRTQPQDLAEAPAPEGEDRPVRTSSRRSVPHLTTARGGAFRAPGRRRCAADVQARDPERFAGTSNVWFAMRNRDAARHHGARVHAGLPALGRACATRRSRLRRGRRSTAATSASRWPTPTDGRIPARLRHVLLQAVRRRAPRFGRPFDWGERMIAHYRRNRVDPRTKTLIFSDQLSFPLAIEIARRFHGRARTSFGIGTNLTNDLGYEPINIVIKMTECNGQPVAKVSDSPGKTVSKDAGYLRYLRQVFGLEPVEKI